MPPSSMRFNTLIRIILTLAFIFQSASIGSARPFRLLALNAVARDHPLPAVSSIKRSVTIPDTTTGTGIVVRDVVIVVVIFTFLLLSLYMLRKCRPTYPRQQSATVPAVIYPVRHRNSPPAFGALVPVQGQHAKRASSVLSDGRTVVNVSSNESTSSLSRPPSTYIPAARVRAPAVGMLGSGMRR